MKAPLVIRQLDFKDGPKMIWKDAVSVAADFKATPRLVLSLNALYTYVEGEFWNRNFTFVAANSNTNANNRFDVQTFNANAVTFSPRGTVTFFAEGSTVPQEGPLTVEITRKGSSLSRCLRVERLLGFLAIGAMNNQDPTETQDCPESSFEGAF